MPRLTVSFAIPTHGRSQLLLEALESGLAQTRLPDEIVVSDDLGSEETKTLVTDFARRASMPVRYVPCTGGASQAANMNNCLRQAACDLVLLLHDDDLLMPRAVEILAHPFEENPAVVGSYGKQLFITNEGQEIPDETERTNLGYHRDPAHAGIQPDAILAGIQQQFPNDGFMVRAAVAKQVLYRPEYRTATDFDFGVRLAEHGAFYYVDEFASKYRNSADSVGRGAGAGSDDSGYIGMRLLLQLLDKHPRLRPEIVTALRNLAPMGIRMAATTGHLREALEWYFGPYHRTRIFTPSGLRTALTMAKASVR